MTRMDRLSRVLKQEAFRLHVTVPVILKRAELHGYRQPQRKKSRTDGRAAKILEVNAIATFCLTWEMIIWLV